MLLEDLAIPLTECFRCTKDQEETKLLYVELRFGPYFCQPVIAGLGNDKIPFICTIDCIWCKLEVVFSEVGPVRRCFMVAEKGVESTARSSYLLVKLCSKHCTARHVSAALMDLITIAGFPSKEPAVDALGGTEPPAQWVMQREDGRHGTNTYISDTGLHRSASSPMVDDACCACLIDDLFVLP